MDDYCEDCMFSLLWMRGNLSLELLVKKEESWEKVGYFATLELVTWWTGKEGWAGGESTCGN